MILCFDIERDFEELKLEIADDFLSENDVRLLDKYISEDITKITVEFPYVDKDFRDMYYNNLSKRFNTVSRDCIRLHFFISEEHVGFITLRETQKNTLGTSYLSPKAIKNFPKGYYCLAEFTVLLEGKKYKINAFPWMQQDANILRCAHISTWSVIRYFSQKYPYYAERTIYELSNFYSTNVRKVPSRGLTVYEIAQILQEARFSPDIYMDEEIEPRNLRKYLYCFIESGIPYIAGLGKEHHAIAIIGHNVRKSFCEKNLTNQIIDAGELIDSLICVDDNKLPYSSIKPDDINSAVVPFYEKMFLDIESVYKLLEFYEETFFSNSKEKYIRRVFLTSAKSLKNYIFKYNDDTIYKDIVVNIEMPYFVWVIEYGKIAEFEKNNISRRLIFDATLLSAKQSSFLLCRDGDRCYIKNEENEDFSKEEIEQALKNKELIDISGELYDEYKINSRDEKIYINNLKEIM